MRKAILAALICLAMLIAVMPAASGPIQFGHTWGTEYSDYAYAVDVDSSGNVYLSGTVYGDVNHPIAATFVAKVNIYGIKMWDVLLMSPTKNLNLIDSTLGPSNSLYVVGQYVENSGYDSGTFYAKIDSSGSIVYQRYLPDLDTPNRMCANTGGNGFIIVGDKTYYGTGAVVAVKDDGSVDWAMSASSPDGESPWAAVTDSSGAVYTFIDSSWDSNVAIAKFSKTGRLVRQSVLLTDTPNDESTWDLALGQDGNIYALGANYGMGKLLFASFTPKLDLIWDEYVGTPTDGYEATRLVVTHDGSLCAIGFTTYTSSGNQGPAVFHMSTSGAILGATFYAEDIFYGTFTMNDASVYPSGGVVVAGHSYGYPKATPVSISDLTVTDIPNAWTADNVDWSKLTLTAVTGDIVSADVDGAMDNYDDGQYWQAWYGIMDPPPPAFKSSISVKTTQDPYVLSFRASASGGRSPYTYEWYFDDGSKASGQKVNHEYAMGGNYQVLLVVTDAKGLVSWATTVVSLPAYPVITNVTHYPDPVYVGDPVSFEVSAYDPDGGSLSYFWDFGDGASMATLVPFASHSYAAQGVYDSWVTVTDDEGLAVSALQTVTVMQHVNMAPIALFNYPPPNPQVGSAVRFDASPSYDNDGWIVSYTWNFGENTSGSGLVVYHTYYSPGTYLVGLSVYDNTGGFGFRQMYVTVQSSEPPDVVLRETFDSWSTLDPGWTFWNSTNPLYNYFTISNGTLFLSDYGNGIIDDSLSAKAYWTSLVQYSDTLSVSYWIYLPLNHDQKVGGYGQFVVFDLLSPAEVQNSTVLPGITTRFLMDDWTGAPNGWSCVDRYNTWHKICDFDAGWHSVTVTMQKGYSTWNAVFDGVSYVGLPFTPSDSTAFDLGRVMFVNALREEVVVAEIDEVIVRTGAVPVPPPVASIKSVTTVGPTIWVDASTSTAAAGIASYTWDWGDGSPEEVFTTPYASHTYLAGNLSAPASSVAAKSRGPPFPYPVFGYVTTLNGTPVVACNVLVANLRTGDTANTTTDVSGFYQCDLSSMPHVFADGDVIQVLAVYDGMSGVGQGIVNTSGSPYMWIDIVLEIVGPGVYYTVMLTVTDMLGQTDSMSVEVWIRFQ